MMTWIVCAALAATQMGPVLGVEGDQFTVDGKPTFLLGCSYYGALGIADEGAIEADFADLRRLGFNWIRVWATWNAFGEDVSAVTPQGDIRKTYMDRLVRLCELAGQHGLIVDVTVSRGNPPFPSNLADHRTVEELLARELRPYRNVYFDVGNERDVSDARYVPTEEVAELVAAVKAIDPERLGTASCNPSPNDVAEFVEESGVDFIAPHLGRHAEAPGQTEGYTRQLLDAMKAAGRVVPVHYQEPFRRGYGDWQPESEDFEHDLEGARRGGSAGWCFHNGDRRTGHEGRPRRSFDMCAGEGRLFEQLDEQERQFLATLMVPAN